MQIDFYTTIIDNYWDMGFSFHLAISLLYYYPDLKIRFFADDEKLYQNLKWDLKWENIIYYDLKKIKDINPSKVIFNFFDKKIDFEYLHSFDYDMKLINFSYFLLHDWVQGLHNTQYISKNVEVTHFIPSLLNNSGGIIINPYLYEFKEQIKEKWIHCARSDFLPHLDTEIYEKEWVSLFCYKETFEIIKIELEKVENTIFFLFDHHYEWKNIVNMPFLNIYEYYKFLHLCDRNIVRWENSLSESLLTLKPFLWDIYKENNLAHTQKIHDFSDYLNNNFWNTFWKYNEIFKKFNLWDKKTWFLEFLNYKNNFEIIWEKIIVENDLIKNISKYIECKNLMKY